MDQHGEIVLMHAVRGALKHQDTQVLRRLLQDRRVVDKINHCAVDEKRIIYSALDLVISPDWTDVKNALKYEIAGLLKTKGAIAMKYEERWKELGNGNTIK